MAQKLNVSRVVKVTINLQPRAAGRRNFGVLLILGASDVIPPDERLRAYTDIDSVAADFGLEAPEYQAAALYFSQSPRPALMYAGRWIRTASPAMLRGAIIGDEDMEGWRAISDGSVTFSIGGEDAELTGLDFTEQTNLDGVASVINTALASHQAGIVYDGERFTVSTTATGASAEIGYVRPGTGGTGIAGRLKLDEASALDPVPGRDAEKLAECVADMADMSGEWYGLMVVDTGLDIDDHLAVAGYIEAAGKSRMYGVTLTDSRTLESVYKDDFASRARELGYKRTVSVYSGNAFAVASLFGRAFTVNFSGSNTTLTLKFKQMPGVVAEGLRESQAQALEAKNCNVFAAYDNDTSILQEGVMASGAYFDEIHGTDWLENAVQTEVWNLLYQSKTKIPQTEGGVTQILTTIEKVLAEAVTNGLVAPGVWNADGFGRLERGDYLPKGYYLYSQPVDEQAQSEREQRKAPPIQCAIKLAGAVHSTDIQIDVNR